MSFARISENLKYLPKIHYIWIGEEAADTMKGVDTYGPWRC